MADFTYSKRSPGLAVPFNFFNPQNIVQPRAPTSDDRAELSALWLQPKDSAGTPVDSVWMLTNPGVWTLLSNAGGGAGIFTSLTVNPGPTSILGTTVINGAGASNTSIGAGSNTGSVTVGWIGNTATLVAGTTVGIEAAAAGGVSIGNLTLTTGDIAIGGSLTSGDISIGGTGAATGIIDIAPGTGAQTINIANSTGIKTLNLANGISGNDINIGNGANTAAQVIDIASGASGADSVVNILAGNATAGISTLNLATGTSAKVIAIGGSGANTITIANSQVGGTLNISNASGPAVLLNNVASITGPVSAATGLTVNTTAGTGIGALITSSGATVDALQLAGGGLKVAPVIPASGASPRVASARFGVCGFTDNVAAAATAALAITNTLSVATSRIMATVQCATGGSACVIRNIDVSVAGTITVNVTNLGGTDTTGNDVVVTFWILSE